MNVVDSMIEIGIWMDGWIFSVISYLYNLIIDLAQYEVFSADSIGSISRKIYALTGIFMLFKVTVSMISYIVNPDEFSDKAKGFGGLIKSVFMCLILIVAVPYIFAEAYYVQKMIINDGTITKIILSGEDSADSSTISLTSTGTNGPGKQIQFILFSQFVKPNTDIDELAVGCKDVYEYADGKKVIEGGHTKFNESCQTALEGLQGVDSSLLQTYIAGMQWSSFKLLSSSTATELYKSTVTINSSGSSYKARVIAYRWPISTIVGFLVMLILTTMAMDIAVRSIKLGFYQIIAPIPILSSIDPKKGKSGMLQKWAQACVQTYLELFIRLASLFLAVFLIIKLTEDSTFSGMAAVVLIIGALMFAKQLPKLLEDILGFKFNLQLNPVKKIETDALGGKGVTGAVAGAAIGALGNGVSLFQENKGLGKLKAIPGAFTGAARGATHGLFENKGMLAQAKRQAEMNAQIRDARLSGSTMGGRFLAGAAGIIGAQTPAEDFERKSKIAEEKLKFHQANLDYAKGTKAGILEDLRTKKHDDMVSLGTTWADSQDKLRQADAALQAAQSSGNAAAIEAAREAVAQAEDDVFDAILDSGVESARMKADRNKYNIRVRNNSEYASEKGYEVSAFDGPIDHKNMKKIKDNSQSGANYYESETYKYRNSNLASEYQGDKKYNDATRFK